MNVETQTIYNLARMYEYVTDIFNLCVINNNNFEKILNDKYQRYAINMCLVQIGEHANRIKTLNENIYFNRQLSLFQIKGMRDRITHSYGNIDYNIVKDVLRRDIPDLKKYLEENIAREVLDNPYILYDEEYKDIVRHSSYHSKEFER